MLQIFVEYENSTFVEMQTVRFADWEVGTACEVGESTVGKLPFDDPGGTLDFKGWRKVYIYETEANPPLLWSGRIMNKDVKRGDDGRGSLRTAGDRWWDCDVADQNVLLGARVFHTDTANRPAETVGERLAWLVDTLALYPTDQGKVEYPSNRMDAANYILQTPADVLSDCAQVGGWNFFAMENGSTRPPVPSLRPEVVFMDPDSSDWESTLRISDYPGDIDNSTTFAHDYGTVLTRKNERVAAGVAVPYNGPGENSYVYVFDEDTGDEFAKVDRLAPMANVKTSAKALVIANRHAAASSTEDDRITCVIEVPPANAGDLRPWHRVQFRSQWVPGYSEWTWMRVVRWGISQTQHGTYRMPLELSPLGEAAPATSCSTVVSTAQVVKAEAEGSLSPSVAITIADDAVLIALLVGNNGNTPSATAMGTISGYTSLENDSVMSRSTFRIAAKAATAGTHTASSTFTGGFGSPGTAVWIATQVALAMSSATPVQSKYQENAFQITLDSTPTVGNIILLFAICDSGNTAIGPNTDVTFGPTVGWTEVMQEYVDTGGISNVRVAIYARCVESGETGAYAYAPTDGYSTGRAICVMEFAP